jgi:murein DD-endopeptidase MepM/ murein hydrolase activator NlpD
MQGPGTNLEVFLGAQSIADLSDRIEFVSSVTESDAELAQQVENLRSSLAVDEANYQDLQSQRRDQLRQAESQQASIKADLARQQELQAQADALYQEASSYYQKKVDQRQEYMRALRQQRRQAAQSGGHAPVAVPGGFVYPLQVCPVQGAVSFGDGFGAPRYAGGFHLHAGVDMLANYGTPIVAPFDGVARSSYNTLGGNAVFVTGRYGYVYNAHLQSYSDHSNGPVHAGDVIGYVGDTGDAIGTPHDHFEYHPNVIPAGWPSSAYGYSVVGGAINPYPLLVNVCG